MTAFQVWLWLALDKIANLMIILVAVSVLLLFFRCMFRDLSRKKMWDFGCTGLALAIMLFAVLATVTPTTKQAAIIYAIPKLSQSSMVTNDLPEVYGMAIEALKSKITEATESK